MITVSVSLDRLAEADADAYGLKLSSEYWELNIFLTESELKDLRTLKPASWESRGSAQIGRSAGVPVFWARSESGVSLLLGHDDETWDIGFTVPFTVLDDIAALCSK